MVDVFSEVDEELRREKFTKLWKRFGPFVIGGAVLFVAAMGGRVYWQDYVATEREAESKRYQAAQADLEAGNETAAAAKFDAIISTSKYGYALLARLQMASDLAGRGDADGAISAYEAIAADTDLDDRYRDFASLMVVTILIDRDAGQEVFDRLAPLVREGGDWTYSASELLGLMYFREGAWQQAGDIFLGLTLDANAPPELRNRAGEFLEMIENSRPAENLFGDDINTPLPLQQTGEPDADESKEN